MTRSGQAVRGRRARGRAGGIVLAATAAASVAATVALAGPAHAAGGHLSITRHGDPGHPLADGATVTTAGVLDIAAQLDPGSGTSTLAVTAPGADAQPVGSGDAGATGSTLTAAIDSDCWSGGGTCSGAHPAPNGTWTVTLTGGETEARSVVLRIPAGPVQGLTGTSSGSVVTLSWPASPYPDVHDYAVDDAHGTVLAGGLSPDEICQTGRCTVNLDLGPGATGRHAFAVQADRATCPDCTDTVPGRPSSPVTVDMTPGADPAATSGPGGGSGTLTPLTGAQRHRLAQLSAQAAQAGTAPPAAVPDVPVSTIAPLPDGTYDPQLHYPDRTVREPLTHATPAADSALPGESAGIGGARLWRAVAGALVLLLAAGHLRSWLTRTASR